jgi:NADPH:quinone reductase-like Zn-dependent oxidoreductase
VGRDAPLGAESVEGAEGMIDALSVSASARPSRSEGPRSPRSRRARKRYDGHRRTGSKHLKAATATKEDFYGTGEEWRRILVVPMDYGSKRGIDVAKATAKVVRFHAVGGPEVLKIEEEPIPEPGKGEVRLKVKAIGLNRAEVMFREGRYLESPGLPSKLGYEAAGEVVAIGPEVDKIWLGKKASTVPAFRMTNYGVYGEVAIVPASALAVYPESLTPEEGTSIWMQYLTAYGALIAHAQITKNDFVIITAASSSVGIAAIEMVKAEGAISIATTRTSKKKATLVGVGATHVIATEEEDFLARVKEITSGKGARVIFDPIAGKGIERLAQAAAVGGIIFEYGALAAEPTPFPLFTALGKGLSIRGYTLREILSVPKMRAPAERYVFNHVEAGDFKPRIDRVFPFEQIVDAHRYMESNEQIGKIVVTV